QGCKVAVQEKVAADCYLMCNRDALVGACTNLVNNSLEAGATSVAVQIVSGQSELVIRVVDNGPGFEESEASHLMEAFYTTKSHGTGLGLAVVQAVVKAHQGQFAIESREQGGAMATIRIPKLKKSI
ncbi:MAG TPA: HAMP domain-containing sensor histidine kinase, partial [Marinobacter sp.]|nr:HAMP domain-containing sensor histidine kinase [Marinobacter sp.]